MKIKKFSNNVTSLFILKISLLLISSNLIFSMNNPKDLNLTDLAAVPVAKLAAQIYEQKGYPAFKKFIKKFPNDDSIFKVFRILICELGRINIFLDNKKKLENYLNHMTKYFIRSNC